MGKSHRDNYKARKKGGSEAFAKKAMRRAPDEHRKKCTSCGTRTRIDKLQLSICPICYKRMFG